MKHLSFFRNLLAPSSLCGLYLALALAALSGGAAAETIRVIDGARVHLSDLTDVQNEELARIDLGPAPPPGVSRLFAREDLRRELRAQGLDTTDLKLPDMVRVRSASRRFSPADIDLLVRARLTSALPSGVSLRELKITRAVVASPRIAVGEIRIPQTPAAPRPCDAHRNRRARARW